MAEHIDQLKIDTKCNAIRHAVGGRQSAVLVEHQACTKLYAVECVAEIGRELEVLTTSNKCKGRGGLDDVEEVLVCGDTRTIRYIQ